MTSSHLHPALTTTLDPVEPPCRRDLCPCALAPHGQTHSMSSTPVCTHILQSPDIFLHFSPQIVLDLHVCEVGGELEDSRGLEGSDFGPRVDVVAGHDALAHLGADAVEGLERALRREC